MYSPDGLNDTYSLKAVPSRTAPAVEIEDRVYIPSVGAGKEPPIAWVQLKDQPATTYSGYLLHNYIIDLKEPLLPSWPWVIMSSLPLAWGHSHIHSFFLSFSLHSVM